MRLNLPARTALAGLFVVVLGLCGYLEAPLRPFGLASSLFTFSVAAGVLLVGAICSTQWPSAPDPVRPSMPPESRGHSLRLIGATAWSLAGSLVVAVELWELFHSPRRSYPTLSSLANELIGPGHRAARSVAFVCWALCGLALSARPRHRL
jgi:hypothetical protein